MDYDSPPAEIAAPFDDAAERVKIPVLVPPRARCPKHDPGEIVVCATDPETFRLRPLPPDISAPIPPARLKLSESTSIGTELESAGVGGFVSNRVMVRAKIKF